MSEPIQAQRLMIYLGESDSWRGHSLYLSILETLRKANVAGATVTRAIAGYGAHSRIRSQAVEVLSTDLPIVVSVIDTPANIERALALVGPMVREGLITVEDVRIIKYAHRYLQPLPADRPVADIMTRQVTAVTPETPARRVVKLLLGKLFKAVPVIDEKRRVVGIVTSSDLLRQAGMPVRLSVGERLEGDDLGAFLARVSQEKTAQDIMSSPVVSAHENEALGHVVQRMLEHRLKRLPVVDDDGRLVGMVSRLDILRAAAGQESSEPERAPEPNTGQTLGDLMSDRLPVVYVHDGLTEVLQKMLDTDVQRVIVLDEQGKPAGIITDGDVVARVTPAMRRNVLEVLAARVLKPDLKLDRTSARELMSEQVLSARPDTSLSDAIRLMLQAGRKQIVVVNEAGNAVGMVDRQTLLAASLGYRK